MIISQLYSHWSHPIDPAYPWFSQAHNPKHPHGWGYPMVDGEMPNRYSRLHLEESTMISAMFPFNITINPSWNHCLLILKSWFWLIKPSWTPYGNPCLLIVKPPFFNDPPKPPEKNPISMVKFRRSSGDRTPRAALGAAWDHRRDGRGRRATAAPERWSKVHIGGLGN